MKNLTKEQVNALLDVLDARARQAYENGKTHKGDQLYDAYDALETWLKKGMVGDIPIDLAALGLDNIELPGAEATSAKIPAKQDISDSDEFSVEIESWRDILKLDPDDVDVQRKLQRRIAEKVDQQIRQKITELRQTSRSERISELDKALQLSSEILSMPIDENTQQKVQQWEAEAKKKRAQIRAECDEIGFLAEAIGNLREAIHLMEEFIKRGRYEFEDRDGSIVSSSVKMSEYNEAYAVFCTQKSREYLERAEQSLPAYPKTAAEVIKFALKKFDKADPSMRDDLQYRLKEIQELINRWESARERIAKATKTADPHARLALLEEAITFYSKMEGLDQLVAEAKEDAAAATLNEVRNIYDAARLHLATGELEQAYHEAAKARIKASEAHGVSKMLDDELLRIDALMTEIAQAAQMARLVAEIEKKVQACIDENDLILARNMIESLDEDARQQPAIKILEGQITRLGNINPR